MTGLALVLSYTRWIMRVGAIALGARAEPGVVAIVMFADQVTAAAHLSTLSCVNLFDVLLSHKIGTLGGSLTRTA